MSILVNLESAAASLAAAETLINKVKVDSKAAVDPKTFIEANTKKVIETLRRDLENNATERSKILLRNCKKAQAKLEAYMRPTRTGLEGLHYMRAERITRAQTIEEALATYKRNVGRLSNDERKDLRYIYDDGLYEAIAMIKPEADYLADGAIDEFRSEAEKGYREEFRLEFETYEQLKEVDGLIESQVAALEAGKEPVKYSWPQVVLEAKENARHNIKGPKPLPEMKVNPYDLGAGEVEGIAEEATAQEAG